MQYSQHSSATVKPIGAIDPGNYAVGTHTSAWIPMGAHASVMALVCAGVLGTSGTLGAQIEESHGADDAARNANAQDVDGLAITALTKAATDDRKQAVLEVKPGDLRATTTHIRVSLAVGVAASDAGALILGVGPRYAEAGKAGMAASVAEVVGL